MMWSDHQRELLAQLGIPEASLAEATQLGASEAAPSTQAKGLVPVALAALTGQLMADLAELKGVQLGGRVLAIAQAATSERDVLAVDGDQVTAVACSKGAEHATHQGLCFVRIPKGEMAVLTTSTGYRLALSNSEAWVIAPFVGELASVWSKQIDVYPEQWCTRHTPTWLAEYLKQEGKAQFAYDAFSAAGLLHRHANLSAAANDAPWQTAVESPADEWLTATGTELCSDAAAAAIAGLDTLSEQLQTLEDDPSPYSSAWRAALLEVCLQREHLETVIESLALLNHSSAAGLREEAQGLDTRFSAWAKALSVSVYLPHALLRSVWVEDPEAWWGQWSGADRIVS